MIDFYATHGSYLLHLAPIWRALAPERRGPIYVDLGRNELAPWAESLHVWIEPGRPPWEPTTDPVVIAGGGDMVGSQGRPVVLLEHGAGQCLAPETRVLTADLRWVPLGDIEVGARLVGFTEERVASTGSNRGYRRWATATVTAHKLIRLPCLRMHLADGTTIIASRNHRWLKANRETWEWQFTEDLHARGQSPGWPSKILKLFDVWGEDRSWGGGYLAAAFDGEGCLNQTARPDDDTMRGNRYQLHFAQRDNAMLAVVLDELRQRGFDFHLGSVGPGRGTNGDVRALNLRGGYREMTRFLGSIRPRRLLGAMRPMDGGKVGGAGQRAARGNGGEPVEVLALEDVGEQTVVALETSTRTFIAEGFASHNSYEGVDNISYSGGFGRDQVRLFLCHEEGTNIFDPSEPDRGWHPVETHPTANIRRAESGIRVAVVGLPTSYGEVVTKEHRYWARPAPDQLGRPDWVEAQHLTLDTWIGLPIDTSIIDDPPRLQRWRRRGPKPQFEACDFTSFSDPRFWWVIGLWWGDGTLSADRGAVIAWACAHAHPEVRDKLLAALRALGYRAVEDQTASRSSSVRICDSVLSRWLATWKEGNSRKVPPLWVEHLPLDCQRELVKGYFAADGHLYDREAVLASIHLPGLLALRRIMARLGIAVSVRDGRGARDAVFPSGRSYRTAPEYTLRTADLSLFNGTPAPRRRNPAIFIEDGLVWSRVRSLEEIEHAKFVPIQTQSETYLTAVGRSHNCPNERTCARNRERYPDAQHVVVGAPSIEPYLRTLDLAGVKRDDPIIAVTFHWRPRLGIPETLPAFEHYAAELLRIARHRTILGHSHPRQAHEFLPWWERNGVHATHDYQVVLGAASVLVADNTSALFEAAALDIPVVVLNAPWYRRDVEHGLRFWEMADVGYQVDQPGELDIAIRAALADPPDVAARRREIAAEVFPYLGDVAVARAVEAILAL